jgi:hypothetical protein
MARLPPSLPRFVNPGLLLAALNRRTGSKSNTQCVNNVRTLNHQAHFAKRALSKEFSRQRRSTGSAVGAFFAPSTTTSWSTTHAYR